MLIYGNTPSDIRKMLFKNKKKVSIFLVAFISLFLLLNCTPKPKQDSGLGAIDKFWDILGGKKPDKCLKYEDCPVWDGNLDTKVYYDLMKLENGSGIIAKSDFNWNVHLYLCHQNKLLDSINGEGAFERLAILSAKDGMIPCPIGDNPHWSYDWESHILEQKNSI